MDDIRLEALIGDALKRRGMSPSAFASVMRKLDDAAEKQAGDEDGGGWSYLSSHPDTAERIEAAERAQ